MPDDFIKVGTQVDTSGLRSGMAESSDVIRAQLAIAKAEFKSAGQDIAQSVNRIVDAQKQATQAATEGHQRLADILNTTAESQKTALSGLIAAQDEAAATAKELELSLKQMGNSAEHTVPQVAAASAAIRVFEGTLPIRAVERFVGQTLGLGPILQAAFPIIGAVAFGEMLAEVINKVIEWKENLKEVIELNQTIGKVVEEADKRTRELNKHTADVKLEIIGLTQGRAAESSARTGLFGNSIKKDQDDIAKLQDQLLSIQASVEFAQRNPKPLIHFGPVEHEDLYKQAEDSQRSMPQIESQLQVARAKLASDQADMQKQQAENAKSSAEDAKRAAEELKRSEDELNRQNAQLLAERNMRIDQEEAKERAHATMVKGVWKELLDANKEVASEYEKQEAGRNKIFDEESRKLQQVYQEEKRVNAEKAKGAEESTLAGYSGQEEKVNARVQVGVEDPGKALQQIIALHAAEYAEEVSFVAKMKALATQENDPVALQKALDQETQIQRKHRQQQLQDDVKLAQQHTQLWQQSFTTVNQGMIGALNGWIEGGENFSRAMRQMLAQLVMNVADFAAQWLLHKAEMWAMDEILGKTSSTTSAIQQIATQAAVASAGAYAATAAIPIVGPALAPAAATEAYSSVISMESLAAFATGGIIPNTGVALVHEGEAVLPADLTNTLRAAASGNAGTKSGAGLTVNQTIQNTGLTDESFKAMASKHANHLLKVVSSGARRMNLTS